MYRQLDHLPASAHKGKLDSLGVNRVGDVGVPVRSNRI